MRSSILLAILAVAAPALAYQHGEIPSHIAVRSDGKGGIEHVYERDRIEHENRIKRDIADAATHQPGKKRQDPMMDYYPVKSDGKGGVVAFATE